jgi:hypothetical protein
MRSSIYLYSAADSRRNGPRAMAGPGRSWLPPSEGLPRAVPAPRNGHGRQGPGKDDAVRGTPKGRTLERRRRARPEGNNDIRNRGLKQQLRLGSKKEFNKAVRQTLGLEVLKRVAGISIGLWEVSNWTLWRGRPPPTRK